MYCGSALLLWGFPSVFPELKALLFPPELPAALADPQLCVAGRCLPHTSVLVPCLGWAPSHRSLPFSGHTCWLLTGPPVGLRCTLSALLLSVFVSCVLVVVAPPGSAWSPPPGRSLLPLGSLLCVVLGLPWPLLCHDNV